MALFKLQPYAFMRWGKRSWASILMTCNQAERAARHYQECIDLFDADEPAKHALASILANADLKSYDLKRAFELYQQLMHQAPSEAAYPFNVAYLKQKAGEHEQAVQLFKLSLDLNPALDRAWYGLALSQIALGDLPSAIDSLERNTRLQPMSPYGWYQLAVTHAHLGQWDTANATAKHLNTFEPKFARGLKADLKALKEEQGHKA